ncbi:MAG: dihydrolipoamide succinyltransferase, partial [Alphaproteobacteria bacterium]|nr:dihydrolipoamide succinyltransferase [Alphaproteobacteria bacterium]
MDIRIPTLGESIAEATIAKWFKKEGDAVQQDEPLLELETDKVTVEVPAPASGKLEAILSPAGSNVQVGAVVGRVAAGVAGAPAAKAPTAAPAPAA